LPEPVAHETAEAAYRAADLDPAVDKLLSSRDIEKMLPVLRSAINNLDESRRPIVWIRLQSVTGNLSA
jgi:hypothetical protein